MASKSKILVIGATGYLGKFILEASVNCGHQTFVLLREQTLMSQGHLQEYFNNLGVNIVIGDIYDEESLISAMKKVDVVISAIGHRSHSNKLLHDQRNIITAIQKAGNIKRFVPSEFGMDVDRTRAVDPAKSSFETKAGIRRLIEENNIPYTIVCANYFARACLQNFFQPDVEAQAPPTESVFILGDGTQRGFYNTEEDIATYTIKAVDDPRTLNKILYVRPQANMYSLDELVSLWENKIGKTLQRTYVQEEQFLQNIQDATDELLKMILAVAYSVFVKGDQSNFEINPSFGVEATSLYPELKYTTVDDILNLFVQEL